MDIKYSLVFDEQQANIIERALDKATTRLESLISACLNEKQIEAAKAVNSDIKALSGLKAQLAEQRAPAGEHEVRPVAAEPKVEKAPKAKKAAKK